MRAENCTSNRDAVIVGWRQVMARRPPVLQGRRGRPLRIRCSQLVDCSAGCDNAVYRQQNGALSYRHRGFHTVRYPAGYWISYFGGATDAGLAVSAAGALFGTLLASFFSARIAAGLVLSAGRLLLGRTW